MRDGLALLLQRSLNVRQHLACAGKRNRGQGRERRGTMIPLPLTLLSSPLTVQHLLQVVHAAKGPLEEDLDENVDLLVHFALAHQNARQGALKRAQA